jgi:hypothetical protein
MISVPLATPTRMSGDEKLLVEGAVQRVLERSRWILGDEVAGFEEEFARYVGAPEVVGVGNGTDALAGHVVTCEQLICLVAGTALIRTSVIRNNVAVTAEHLLAHPGNSFLLSEGTFIDYDLHTPDSEIIVFASEAFQPMRSERIPSDD